MKLNGFSIVCIGISIYILIHILRFLSSVKNHEKKIEIYCEILKSKECKFPNLNCGNCKIWIKNCRKEYLKSIEYKLFKSEKLNYFKKRKIIKNNSKNV